MIFPVQSWGGSSVMSADQRTFWRRLIALVLVLMAWLGLWVLSRTAVPDYGGRTATAWLSELAEADAQRKQAALKAFVAMGEPAVPVLVRALEGRASPVERLIFWLESRVPVFRSWMPSVADRQGAALEALERMEAVSALPALIRFLEMPPGPTALDEARRAQAAAIVGGMAGQAVDAVPVLLALIRADGGRGSPSAQAALVAVNRIGGVRVQVGPVLVECLRSGNERMRSLAASGLGTWGADAAFAVQPLREALWRPDAEAFTGVAMAIGQLGEIAREATPDLVLGLQHESSMVRAVAARNLARVRPDPGLAVAPLMEALSDKDPFVRSQAAWALGQLGAAAMRAAVALARALSDESEAVQISVIEALGSIGPGAMEAVPALERARGNRQAGLARFVATALARIQNEATEAVLPQARITSSAAMD
jgi:HEAT repeat protein